VTEVHLSQFFKIHSKEELLFDHAMPANQKAAKPAGTTVESVCQYMENRKIPPIVKTINNSGIPISSIVGNMLNFVRKIHFTFTAHDPKVLMEQVLLLATIK
jgi:adenine/guanine phosphoribosyltransferase-like PRPP-binding protein